MAQRFTGLIGTALDDHTGANLRVGGAAIQGDLTELFDRTIALTYSITLAPNTLGDGLALDAAVLATVGNQQFSPSLHLSGNGWATTPGASQSVDWIMYVSPTQGAANPTSSLQFASSTNGGAYATCFYMTSGGGAANTVTFMGGIATPNLRVTGATLPVAGIYSAGANSLNFAANAAAAGSFDGNKNFIHLFAEADQSAYTDVVAGARTVPNNISTYISNAGAQSSIVITAPTTPVDGQILEVLTMAALTTCTILGFTLTLAAKQGVRFRYKAALTTWFQII